MVRTDDASANEVEIDEVEWEIVRLMDGSRTRDQLLEAALNLGITATGQQLDLLIEQLGAEGFLEERGADGAGSTSASKEWTWGGEEGSTAAFQEASAHRPSYQPPSTDQDDGALEIQFEDRVEKAVVEDESTMSAEEGSTMAVEEGSTMAVDAGSTVALDAGSTVALDAGSTQAAVGFGPQSTENIDDLDIEGAVSNATKGGRSPVQLEKPGVNLRDRSEHEPAEEGSTELLATSATSSAPLAGFNFGGSNGPAPKPEVRSSPPPSRRDSTLGGRLVAPKMPAPMKIAPSSPPAPAEKPRSSRNSMYDPLAAGAAALSIDSAFDHSKRLQQTQSRPIPKPASSIDRPSNPPKSIQPPSRSSRPAPADSPMVPSETTEMPAAGSGGGDRNPEDLMEQAAKAFFEEGDLKLAARLAAEVLVRDPQNPVAKRYVRVYYALRTHRKGQAPAGQATIGAAGPDEVPLVLRGIHGLMGRAALKEASELATVALKMDPDNLQIQSWVRTFTAIANLLAKKRGEPPVVASVPGEPGREEAAKLIAPSDFLLLNGRADEARVLVELAHSLDSNNTEVLRLKELVGSSQVAPLPEATELEAGVINLRTLLLLGRRKVNAFLLELEKVPLAQATSKIPAFKYLLGAFAGLIIILSVLLIPMPLRVSEKAELHPALRREIRASIEGQIVQVEKNEGENVKAGELLAVLDKRDVLSEMAIVEANLSRVKTEFLQLEEGGAPQQLLTARAVVAQRRAELREAQARLLRTQELHKAKLASDQGLESIRGEIESKSKELDRAREDLDHLRVAASEPVRTKEAELSRIDAELDLVKEEIERREIRSPIDGVLITPRFNEKVGRAAAIGDLIAEVARLDRMRIDILVPENELDAVKLGQPLSLRVRSYPNESFESTVEQIAPVAETIEGADDPVIRVVAHVANPKGLLKDEMTGTAAINCGSRPLLILMGRRFLKWWRDMFL